MNETQRDSDARCAASSTSWRASAPSSRRASPSCARRSTRSLAQEASARRRCCERGRGHAVRRRLRSRAALTDTRAFEIARAMLDGFDRHYRLFRQASAEAKERFEAADWHGQQRAQAQRIEFYDLRVDEAAERLQSEFEAATLPMEVWQQVKLHYIGLLIDHHQPELRRDLLQLGDDQDPAPQLLPQRLHLRPPGGLDRLHRERRAGGAADLPRLLPDARDAGRDLAARRHNFQLAREFEDLEPRRRRGDGGGGRAARRSSACARTSRSRCCRRCSSATRAPTSSARSSTASPRRRSRCRSCTASDGRLVIDTALFGEDDLLLLFSFARAYFMVAMEIPSAYVQFLRSLMPRKPRSEIYSALGLQKQGKNMFYRDFLMHMRHSSDKFRIAPGIKGMVMLVFDLPSFPYVFKVIKDFYPPQKDTTREQIKAKYLLVKQHDRVGRMADTLEYSDVAFPRARFDDELVDELRHFCPSLLEDDGDALVIRHVYIERRMIPLNIYLQEATRRADRAGGGRVRQRDQGPGARQHLPRRHAVEELRRHAPRQGRVLRLRRDRVPDRLQFPQGARAAQRGRGDVGRGLVQGRPEGRLSGDLRAVPARQSGGPRGLHGAPRRPARRGILARPQGGNPGRLRA